MPQTRLQARGLAMAGPVADAARPRVESPRARAAFRPSAREWVEDPDLAAVRELDADGPYSASRTPAQMPRGAPGPWNLGSSALGPSTSSGSPSRPKLA